MEKVTEPSGRYVFRVRFGHSFQPRDEIAEELETLGSLLEWSSLNLLAVDAVDQEHARLVADFLAEREKAGQLIYETGRSRSGNPVAKARGRLDDKPSPAGRQASIGDSW